MRARRARLLKLEICDSFIFSYLWSKYIHKLKDLEGKEGKTEFQWYPDVKW